MKIYFIPLFCFILAACSSTPPKLEYPTGSNRVPINNPTTNITNIETSTIDVSDSSID